MPVSRRNTSKTTSLSNSPSKAVHEVSSPARSRRNKVDLLKQNSDTDDDLNDSEAELAIATVSPKEPISFKKVTTRVISACIMCIFFLVLVQSGHFYCIITGVLVQIELYRELVNVRYVEAKENKMPLFRSLQWAWFLWAMIASHGRSLDEFCHDHKCKVDSNFLNYGIFTYCMFFTLFVTTVVSLRPGLLRYQLSQYMWTIIIIVIVVVQTQHLVSNILLGLFWFFFPFATVVMNDCSAYVCGVTFGRKFIKAPFIPLSPNKTWEGFIGAAILTIIFSYYFPVVLAKYDWFKCPIQEISQDTSLSPFYHGIKVYLGSDSKVLYGSSDENSYTCVYDTKLSKIMLELYEEKIPNFSPIQLHGLVFGLFASLVAPFGGFFASAIKRAYGKKDFDSFMPGHGGMMDRMDCQLIMIMFTSFYLSTFIDKRTLPDKLSDKLMTLDFNKLSDVFKTLDNETITKIKELVI